MAQDVRTVLDEALALPEAERALVAAELLSSFADPDEDSSSSSSSSAAKEFTLEVERRIERIVSGESKGIDYATAQKMLNEALAQG